MEIIRPSGFLSRYVERYWVLEAEAADGEVCERVIPTGNVELMFHYGEPFVEKYPGGSIPQPRSFVSGISGAYTDVATRGESGVIAVTFRPLGACHFFAFPMREIEDSIVDLAAIDRIGIRPVEDKVRSSASLSGKIEAIEAFLLGRFRPADADSLRLMEGGLSLIEKSRGRMNAADMAKRLFVTEKSLERKFSALLGKTPKQFMRIVRFWEVIRALTRPDAGSLTDIAFASGYYDQPHFINDFKALTGCAPRDYRERYTCNSVRVS